jgi:hypothetical protein
LLSNEQAAQESDTTMVHSSTTAGFTTMKSINNMLRSFQCYHCNKFIFFLLLATVLGSCQLVKAQRFAGHSPNTVWKQVNNATATVIFPPTIDSAIAIRVANITALLHQNTTSTLGFQQKKINIVLQPYTTISNAYVGLGPFRSEFFMTPLQNSFQLGSLPWVDNLAIHEYRHVQQYNNFNVGLSKVVGLALGENARALANALAIPNWFWEGDAVFQETLVGQQGRGRLPFFYKDAAALWQAQKKYSWMKWRNGSLKDFVPDHYKLGYLQVAYGYKKYGNDFWRSVTHDAAAFKGVLYPFQQAVKKYSHQSSYHQFTQAAFNYFQQQYIGSSHLPLGSTPPLLPQKRQPVVDKMFPAFTEEGNLVYLKKSYRQIPVFVVEKNGRERIIRVRNIAVDDQYRYKHGKIVYASWKPHLRWSWNDYAEIQILNTASGKQKTITHHTKYFSPDISDDGKAILAVAVLPDQSSALHIINATNGSIDKKLPNPEKLFYTYPIFINHQLSVAAVRNRVGQMALVLIDLKEGTSKNLTPFAWRVIGFPHIKNDTVYFTASNHKVDELYAVDIANKNIFHCTIKPKGLGIYQPTVNEKELCFSSFTADGYTLEKYFLSTLLWEPISDAKWELPFLKEPIDTTLPAGDVLLNHVPTTPISVKRYSKSFHLFNFHSLLPLLAEPNYTLSAISENVLNTLQSELLVGYNTNERFKQIAANMLYGQWFPVISVGALYNIDRLGVDSNYKNFRFNEWQWNAGFNLPLNLSKGRSLLQLNAGSKWVHNQLMYKEGNKNSVPNKAFGYVSSTVSLTHQIQQARQHIFPRLAQTATINYRYALSGLSGYQLNANASLYFPGLYVNHNIVINWAWADRDTLRQINFSNNFPFSRGYATNNLYRMQKWGINYHFPLAYPDAGVANLVYLLRIRANAFYDYTIGHVLYKRIFSNQSFRQNTNFRSTGVEIYFDTKWWNELPLTVGIRYSRLLDKDVFGAAGANRIELVLPSNLLSR